MIAATAIGHLGRDPEMGNAGKAELCRLALATNHGYGDRRITTWLRVTVWGKQGNACYSTLQKGDQVACVGEIYEDVWQDQEGNERKTLSMNCNRVEFLTVQRGQAATVADGHPGKEPLF